MTAPGGRCRKPLRQRGPCRNARPQQHPMRTWFTSMVRVPTLLDRGAAAPRMLTLDLHYRRYVAISWAPLLRTSPTYTRVVVSWSQLRFLLLQSQADATTLHSQVSFWKLLSFTQAIKPLMCSLDIKTYLNLKAMFSNKVGVSFLPVYLDARVEQRPQGRLIHACFIFPLNPFSPKRRHKQWSQYSFIGSNALPLKQIYVHSGHYTFIKTNRI